MLAGIWGLLVEGLGHGLSSHVWWQFYAEDLGSGLPWKLGLRGCCCLVMKSCSTLFVTPWTIACQAPLSMGFSRQEYRNGLPFPSPRNFLDPGIKPASPALQADSLPLSHQGCPL